ncbi:CNNM domain-containing protein [Chloroflexota bacterium]
MANIELYLSLFIVCLLLSIFFSGSETAFISLQRIRIEHLIKNKVRGARRVARIIEQPEKLLSTVLLGNTLVNTAAAALATSMAISIWGEHGVIYTTIGVTVILLIFCEVTPKTVAAQHSERLSLLVARPLSFIAWLFTPFVIALSWIADLLN